MDYELSALSLSAIIDFVCLLFRDEIDITRVNYFTRVSYSLHIVSARLKYTTTPGTAALLRTRDHFTAWALMQPDGEAMTLRTSLRVRVDQRAAVLTGKRSLFILPLPCHDEISLLRHPAHHQPAPQLRIEVGGLGRHLLSCSRYQTNRLH